MGFGSVSITKELVIRYGETKGCAGCRYAAGKQSWFQGHNQHCRKRFLDLSNEPGNGELKAKIDRALEKATRRWLDTDGAGGASSSKKTRLDGDHPGIGHSAVVRPSPPPESMPQSETGTKRTASKQNCQRAPPCVLCVSNAYGRGAWKGFGSA